MLREDASRTHVQARREEIVAVYESANQPMVQIPGRAAQQAQAAVIGMRKGRGTFEVVVVLTFAQAQENVVYASDAPVPQDELEAAVEEGLNFAESMGFILESNWAGQDPRQKEETMQRMTAFQPPQQKEVEAPAERPKPTDPLSAIARLFGAFALLLAVAVCACSGISAEQRRRSAEIHYDLGTNLLQNGDVQGALKEYLDADKDDADLPQTPNALGLLYAYSLARPQDAEEQFLRAIALDKDFAEARNNLGAFYMARGRFAEAIPQFEAALANPLYRDRVIAESNLGWALYKVGQPEKGMRRIETALLIAPKYCLGWRQLGTIHAERGELIAASEAFAKYAAACPETADAHLQTAKILARQSRATEARLEFQRCAGIKDEREAGVARECQRLLKELSP